MMKKRVFSFLAALCLVGSSIPAAAASRYDVRFDAEEYEYFYPASSAEIYHDGHGEFWVEDTMGTITSDIGATAVIRPDIVTVTEQLPAYPGSWQGESGAGVFTPSSAILAKRRHTRNPAVPRKYGDGLRGNVEQQYGEGRRPFYRNKRMERKFLLRWA